MRSISVFMWILAQFSKFQTPSDLSDGLKTGAFNASLALAQGSLTKPHSGAVPFRWPAIELMIQLCEILIDTSVQLTNIPHFRELAAKRLQTGCTQTAVRLKKDCTIQLQSRNLD